MTNRDMRYRLMQFCASELSCGADDFLSDANKVVLSQSESDPLFLMKCFGNAAVVKANAAVYDWFVDFVSKHTGFRCFDGVQFSIISRELARHDYAISCGQGALPDISLPRGTRADLPGHTRVFAKEDVARFYGSEIDRRDWHMLYESDDTQIIMARYDGDRVAGFAVADRHTDDVYDIGYEVLPAYRQRGIATALTRELTAMLLDRDIIPFATFAWSNIASKNVLIKSGYVMAWSSMGACDRDFARRVFEGTVQ